MPITGMRKISTSFREGQTGSKRTRIKIPQPTYKSLYIKGKDAVRQKLLRQSLDPFALHRRGLLGKIVDPTDPREKRAVSESQVRGSLPERILYLYLVKNLHLKSGIDFDFQSSLDGGRMELGGIVADFLFEIQKFVINVQGPTHTEFLRGRKDEEQRGILNSMGYTVYDITDEEIYNVAIFEDKIRRIFNLSGGGGGGYSYEHNSEADHASNAYLFSGDILDAVLNLYDRIEAFSG